jgi:hypothetical protein
VQHSSCPERQFIELSPVGDRIPNQTAARRPIAMAEQSSSTGLRIVLTGRDHSGIR